MKAKRAVKRLSRVEQLLADVIKGVSGLEQQVRDLLGSAKASVVSAKKTMQQKATAPADAKKPSAKSEKPIKTRGTVKRKKKPASAARHAAPRAKAAKTSAKKAAVKAQKPKRATPAVKKLRPKVRSPRSGAARTHLAEPLSPAPEPLPEVNTEPPSAPDGFEPVPH
jgi:hypothetical protein